jgi:hypothetical protein
LGQRVAEARRLGGLAAATTLIGLLDDRPRHPEGLPEIDSKEL